MKKPIKIYRLRAVKSMEMRDFYFENYAYVYACAKELKSAGYFISITMQ